MLNCNNNLNKKLQNLWIKSHRDNILPYPQGPPAAAVKEGKTLPVADGIAFSCSNYNKPEASLRYIFKEIERTVYAPHIPSEELEKLRDHFNPDLKRWANQGILMLNTALTTSIGKIGSHYDLWKPFMNYLFSMLSEYNTGLIYVFLGAKAKEWESKIGKSNHKLFVNHPAYAAYSKSKTWETDDLFNKISTLVKEHYDETIGW